jgi:hypothetical protein
MKIAVCFSGQPRFINTYAHAIKQYLLNLYDTDIYAHFWWSDDLKGKQINMAYKDTYDDKNHLQEFINTYQPTHISYEPQKQFDISNYTLDTLEPDLKNVYTPDQYKDLYQRVNSQWYSLQKCYQQIQYPEKYDYIIRIRTDTRLTKPIHLDFLSKTTLYIQDGKCTGADRKYADWFMLGHATVMKEFVNIYDQVYTYWHKGSIHIHKFIQSYVTDFNIPNAPFEFHTRIEHGCYKLKP